MGRAVSNINVVNARFETADFSGEWLASIGRPELKGSWIVYGGSGSGKTTFVLQLSKYLSGFKKTAYNSIEQGLSLSFKTAWKRVQMEEAGANIILLKKESLQELRERLRKRKSPDIIIIDSVHYWLGFRVADYMKLLEEFPAKLFIIIAHEKSGQPKGHIAEFIRFNSDVKIRVEGYKAFFTSRYENPEAGEGGADYIIWEKGANEYWIDKF